MPPISTLIALADPTRCRIIELLHNGPQPVHVLASAFSISRPAISRHLRVLKQAKLITEKKSGRENLYRLQPKRLEPVQGWIAAMLVNPQSLAESRTAPRQVSTPPAQRSAQPAKASGISQMGFDF